MTRVCEYRLLTWQDEFAASWNGTVSLYDDIRFLQQKTILPRGRRVKQLRITFHREMRRKYNILLEDDKPVGGQWNYDRENRKPLKSGLSYLPKPFEPDEITTQILEVVEEGFNIIGTLDAFDMAVTREQV